MSTHMACPPSHYHRACRAAHRLEQEEGVPRQVVGTEQPPQDTDRALKQVDIHVLIKV